MDVTFVVEIAIALVLLWALLLAVFWALRPRGVPTREIVRVVPDLLRLIRSLIADGHTPLDVRIVLVGLLVWIISPIDLIPEFIPGLGPLDDVIVAVVALRYVRRRIGIDNLRQSWPGTSDGFSVVTRILGSS